MAHQTVYDRDLQPADKDRVITQITVTSSGSVQTVSDMPNIYHWHLYLLLGAPNGVSNSQSVLFDMIPTMPPTGTLIISSKITPQSQSPHKIELPIRTVGEPVLSQFIDFFISNRMDRYQFDESGSGCLYWVMVAIEKLENAQMIEAGASSMLRTLHNEQAILHPERHPMPLRKGQYY